MFFDNMGDLDDLSDEELTEEKLSEIVAYLKKQLKIKDKQLKEKDKQLKEKDAIIKDLLAALKRRDDALEKSTTKAAEAVAEATIQRDRTGALASILRKTAVIDALRVHNTALSTQLLDFGITPVPAPQPAVPAQQTATTAGAAAATSVANAAAATSVANAAAATSAASAAGAAALASLPLPPQQPGTSGGRIG